MAEETIAQRGRKTVVGLVADPDLPAEIAAKISDDLPEVLADKVSSEVEWDVQVLRRAMPLDEDGNIEFWTYSNDLLREQGWEFVICLTELTRRIGSHLLISDVNSTRGAAIISLPALGPFRLRHYARESIVDVVRALTSDDLQPRLPELASGRSGPLSRRMFSPVAEDTAAGEVGTDSYLELTGVRGRFRLLSGMVRINRPWRLVPSLSSAIAAASAAAAFGIFYSSIWSMADALSIGRLGLITIIAVTAMIMWLIAYNRLWQRYSTADERKEAALYNSATVLTLAIGVSCMYVLLFILTLCAALVVIPGSFLETTLDHPITLMDYVSVAWLASSLGAVAGALGSTFESDEAIWQATYGRRERERHARKAREQEQREQ